MVRGQLLSERKVCRSFGSASLDVSRKVPCGLPDEARLTEDITALAEEFGRYGGTSIAPLPGSPLRADLHAILLSIGVSAFNVRYGGGGGGGGRC